LALPEITISSYDRFLTGLTKNGPGPDLLEKKFGAKAEFWDSQQAGKKKYSKVSIAFYVPADK